MPLSASKLYYFLSHREVQQQTTASGYYSLVGPSSRVLLADHATFQTSAQGLVDRVVKPGKCTRIFVPLVFSYAPDVTVLCDDKSLYHFTTVY